MSDRGPQPWGPWVLALGTLLVGVLAVTIEGIRVLRRRFAREN